jgi:hypothetical protein
MHGRAHARGGQAWRRRAPARGDRGHSAKQLETTACTTFEACIKANLTRLGFCLLYHAQEGALAIDKGSYMTLPLG